MSGTILDRGELTGHELEEKLGEGVPDGFFLEITETNLDLFLRALRKDKDYFSIFVARQPGKPGDVVIEDIEDIQVEHRYATISGRLGRELLPVVIGKKDKPSEDDYVLGLPCKIMFRTYQDD